MSRSFAVRCVADVLLGLAAVALLVMASRHAQSVPWLIACVSVVITAALVAGYYEPSAKRVIIHPFLVMAPEIVVFPLAFFTCRGFECGAIIGVMMVASLFTFVLVALAFAAFFVRRQLQPKAERSREAEAVR